METIMNRVRQGMILVSFLAVLYSCTGPADNIVPPPPPIDTYDIHKDGGLIYNPLFRQVADSREEREEEGEVQRIEQTLQLGKYTLRYTGSLPVIIRSCSAPSTAITKSGMIPVTIGTVNGCL